MELPVDVAADGDGAFLQAVSNGGAVASVGERRGRTTGCTLDSS
jgi:hypothetical protein